MFLENGAKGYGAVLLRGPVTCPHSYFVKIYADGIVSGGAWHLGSRYGNATIKYPNGDVFVGIWDSAKETGSGNIYYAGGIAEACTVDSSNTPRPLSRDFTTKTYTSVVLGGVDFGPGTYRGQVVNHKRNGFGKLFMDSGDTIEGNWEHDQMQGKATLTSKAGGGYTGEWSMGLKHGEGTETSPNGATWKATWSWGISPTEGVYTRDGHTYTQRWEDYGDAKHSQGFNFPSRYHVKTTDQIQFADKTSGRGRYLYFENEPHGHFVLTYADGTTSAGRYSHGQRSGYQTVKFTNGDVFVGYFKKGSGGSGSMYYAGGRVAALYLDNNNTPVEYGYCVVM